MIKNQSLKEKIYINLNKEFSNINIYTYKTIPSTKHQAKVEWEKVFTPLLILVFI